MCVPFSESHTQTVPNRASDCMGLSKRRFEVQKHFVTLVLPVSLCAMVEAERQRRQRHPSSRSLSSALNLGQSQHQEPFHSWPLAVICHKSCSHRVGTLVIMATFMISQQVLPLRDHWCECLVLSSPCDPFLELDGKVEPASRLIGTDRNRRCFLFGPQMGWHSYNSITCIT